MLVVKIIAFLLAVILLQTGIAAQRVQAERIVYSREQLIDLKPAGLADRPAEVPAELRRKTHRGCRGGLKRRKNNDRLRQRRLEKRRFVEKCLPSLIMGNVRSLGNKMDELTALARSQKEYRECSIMCFTETWLHQDIPDDVSIAGFHTVRADRDCAKSGKRKGGGVAVLVNNRWCNPAHITIKEHICDPNMELCAVGLRPYYLPREFSQVIMVAVYVPPSANPTSAIDAIHSAIAQLQTQHPSAFIAISVCELSHQRGRTIDLLYANAKEAYSSSPLPPLGRSDHNLIHLEPCYVPVVKSQPVTTKTVRRWSEEAYETLRGCFEVTDWQALCEPHGEDINGLTVCVTDYINFCVDTIVPPETVLCYPNNKPWVTKEVKTILNDKRRAFTAGNREEVRTIQRELKVKIKEAKQKYRRKLEWKLQQNN
ncbi:hypothetical protein N1851_017607 [Merluccius polli]|uniref:Uncharacterized protein n=1 Tax=Merluccius polli TaxID=89951 RepID=A0AA47P226_MERPO|nr:hypothetical protein N1851_017607 [Merluccius polli]